MADIDTCIACGATVPEGRQVCPVCENRARDVPPSPCHACQRLNKGRCRCVPWIVWFREQWGEIRQMFGTSEKSGGDTK